MGFLGTFFGIIGFGIGIPFGLFVGFLLFIYFQPRDVEDPIVRPLHELDSDTIRDLLPEVPLWVKYSDYDRVDWLSRFVSDMWPYLNKAICGMIRSETKPIFAEYIGMYQIKSIEFEKLTLGTLPPTIHGIKIYETNEKELVFEPVFKWAGNPDITLLVDLQIFATPCITWTPLVPTFPCFANVVISLMEKPHIDFGMKVLGGDVMAIPGLYRFVQETIKKKIARLYLWPQILEIPILDRSIASTKKPVGILHVKVIRALKLLKMDILGTSDPYVKLSLSGERLPAKKTTVKLKNLNPEWNEDFKLIVKDPESQVLQIHVYDWEKMIKRTRDPCWNKEFQFMLDEAPLEDMIHIEIMSKRFGFSFHSKESLGHVDINLADVVYNGRINEKYHLINSRNGVIHVDIRWKTI